MKGWGNLLGLLGILAAATVLCALWTGGVRLYYRLRGPRPKLLRQRCSDGWELGVHYRSAARRQFAEPVLLCHGLAANHLNFDFEPPFSLAHALAERGFDCFSVDWRGSGASRRSPGRLRWANYSVDDHIHKDTPALLELALKKTGATQAFWIGHSLGGLIGLGAAQGEGAGQLRGLVTVGAPVFFNYDRMIRQAVRFGLAAAWPFRFRHELLSAALAPFLGRLVLPFSDVIVYPRHIPPEVQRKLYAHLITSVGRGVLAQFHGWIVDNAFRSLDLQVDYREGLKCIRQPLLFIAGSRDRLAPPVAVRGAFELAPSLDKTLKIFGREHGYTQEYGHGDLIFGECAPKEVFPFIADWLACRGTPLDGEVARCAPDASALSVRRRRRR
jgi:pimeloyl-ACP methyl ester carboxylesterase